MITLCIRYTFNPDKLAAFRAYVEGELGEQGPIRRSGGKTLGYFLPTDFAGPTNEALGLIEFSDLAAYEKYRGALANDPDHRKNVAALEQSGAAVTMTRSILHRVGQG
jgi:NIPSNAP